MPTFTPELNSRPGKNGTHAILIRVTVNRIHKREHTGFYVRKQDWNAEKKNVRSSHPNAATLNQMILNKIRAYESTAASITETTSSVMILQRQNSTSISPLEFMQQISDSFDKLKKYDTAARYRVVKNHLIKFAGEKIKWKQIDTPFINRFVNYLNESHNPNTTRATISKVKAMWVRAQRKSELQITWNPFLEIELPRKKAYKDRLDQLELNQLSNVITAKGSWLYHAQNIFMFQYYTFGLRVGNVLRLTGGNLKKDRLIFNQIKVDNSKEIILSKQSVSILNKYNAFNREPGQYLFPFLQKGDELNHRYFLNRIATVTTILNRNLKVLAKIAKIKKKLSTHTARHTFANMAKSRFNNLYAISKALGHTKLSTTQEYIDDFDTNLQQELSDKVYTTSEQLPRSHKTK